MNDNNQQAAREWLPIESAPKNANWWLVWSSAYQRPVVVEHRSDDGTYWEGDWDYDVRATHYMPLPAPPSPTQEMDHEG